MSQSTCFADHIILAMVPLGIITAVVGAIRVGGPPWLKAMIGRARESRAVVETELMSSTSNEVCELWNGKEIVRIMGAKGPIREFIILFPEDYHPKRLEKYSIKVMEIDLEDKSGERSDWKQYLNTDSEQAQDHFSRNGILTTASGTPEADLEGTAPWSRFWKSCDVEQGVPAPVRGTEHSGPALDSIFVLRNTSEDSPNLTFNASSLSSKLRLYTAAMAATLLQLSIVTYFGIVTYHPELVSPDIGPTPAYAFPTACVGTVSLVAGMALCSFVVEQSTEEVTYRPVKGLTADLVWLQRSDVVNDQAFKSFVVYPNRSTQKIITSRRKKSRADSDSSGVSPGDTRGSQYYRGPHWLHWRTKQQVIICTIITLSGFILQFVGLRGMHWSAPLVHVGGILLMTCLRVWVHRHLGGTPKSQELSKGFELDWLALALAGKRKDAHFMYRERHDRTGHHRPTAVNEEVTRSGEESWDWEICPVEIDTEFDDYSIEASNSNPDGNTTTASQVTIPGGSVSQADRTLALRTELGALARWPGCASGKAIAVARAIEVVMERLGSSTIPDNEILAWSMNCTGSIKGKEEISFHLTKAATGWTASSSEIDAALSLWLYSQSIGINDEIMSRKRTTSNFKYNDAWLRVTGTEMHRSFKILGWNTTQLQQCLKLWVPEVLPTLHFTSFEGLFHHDARPLTGCANHESRPFWSRNTKVVDVITGHPRVGYVGPQNIQRAASNREFALLQAESYPTLPTLCAQHIFTTFVITACSKTDWLNRFEGNAEIRSIGTTIDHIGDLNQKLFTLRNAELSELAQGIQATGIGSIEDVYLMILPAFCLANKLPRASPIIPYVHQRAKASEAQERWRDAANAYIWLLQAMSWFPHDEEFAVEITALFMQFLISVKSTLAWRERHALSSIGDLLFTQPRLEKRASNERKT